MVMTLGFDPQYSAKLDATDLSDIITKPYTRYLDPQTGLDTLAFEQEPTPDERWQITQRITKPANQTLLEQRVDALLANLRTIRDSSGTLTAANLSDAVRVLARGEIGLIRLVRQEFDSPD